MDRTFFALAAGAAFLGVAAGAFGAHGLKDHLSTDQLNTFQTGVEYQMYGALALFATAWAAQQWPGNLVTSAGWLLVAAIVLFSGSLYALTVTDSKLIGIVTPFGGLCFLAAFVCLVVAPLRASR